MIFRWERVEQRDADGVLQACGIRWTEARTIVESSFETIAIGIFLAGGWALLVGAAMAVGGIGPVWVPAAGVLLLAMSYGVIWTSLRTPGRQRELSFWDDGLVYAPFGLSPRYTDEDALGAPHTAIMTIEAEQLVQPKGDMPVSYTHGVRIVFRNGEIAHIARHLDPDDAHRLGVRLSLALADLRESIASGALRPKSAADATID